jgi:hypothetical protein
MIWEACMVSVPYTTSVLAVLLTLAGFGQTPASLTAEQRGDIMMARKMYREANDL